MRFMKNSSVFGGWRVLMAFAAAVVVGAAAVSCSDEPDVEPGEEIEIVEPGGVTMPSEERIAMPVAIVGGGGSALDAALARRCTSRGELTLGSTGVVIVGCDDMEANTDAIVAAYDNGAIIVVTNPDDELVASWCRSADIPYIGDGDNSDGDDHLLYCFNNRNDFYFLDDFVDDLPDPDHDRALNSFTTWVNTHSREAVRPAMAAMRAFGSRGGDIDIAKTFAAQTVTHAYSIGIKDGELAHVALSKADRLTKSSTIDVAYRIYPLYSFRENATFGDFYIVQSSVTVHNGDMFEGQWTKKHGGVHARLGGFYMSKFKLDATFQKVTSSTKGGKVSDVYSDFDGVNYPAGATPVPESSVGATTYQSGFSWGLNASVSGGFQGKTPTGQIALGGNVGWSNSESRTISDLTIEKNAPGNRVGYVFTVNNLPHTSGGSKHTDIPQIAKSDFTMYQTWVWHVSSTKNNDTDTFGMKVSADVEYKGYHWYSSAADFSVKTFGDALPAGSRTFPVKFLPPNRVPYGQLVLVNTSKSHQYLHSVRIWKSTNSTDKPDYTIGQTIASSQGSSSTAVNSASLALPVGKYRIEAVRCNLSKEGEETDRVEVVSRNDVAITLAKDTNIDGGSIDFKVK